MVRSNRGRAAALRHVWSWPVHSPVRLTATVIAALVVIVIGGKLMRSTGDSSPAPAPPSTVVVTHTATPTPSESDGPL